MLLALILCAAAHLPHDYVKGVAVPEDFEESAVAWALLFVDGRVSTARRWALFQTVDGGSRWYPSPVPVFPGDPSQLTNWGGQPLLWSAQHMSHLDDGEWTSRIPPGGVVAGGEGGGAGLAVATTRGLWWGAEPGADWERQATETAFVEVSVSVDGSRIAAIDDVGQVHYGPVGDVVLLPSPTEEAVAVLGLGDVLYAATSDAIYAWSGQAWRSCAALPVSEPMLDNAGVPVRIAARGGEMLVGTGQKTYFSADFCRNFLEAPPFGDAAIYGDEDGALPSLDANVTALWLGEDGLTLVGGYRGIAIQAEQAGPFVRPRFMDGSFVRDLAWVPGGGAIFATSYSGFLLRHDAQGATLLGEEADGPDRFGRVVVALSSEHLRYAGDLKVARESVDGGLTWSSSTDPVAAFGGAWMTGGQFWLAASDGMGLFRSEDGKSWTVVEGLEDSVALVHAGFLDGSAGFFTSASGGVPQIFFVDTAGTVRQITHQGGVVRAALSWPPGDGRRLLVANPSGISISEDAGETFEEAIALPGGALSLNVTDDGVLFAVDAVDGLWRSEDGGDNWTGLAVTLPSIQEIEVSPGFAKRPLVVAATLGGLYWSLDRGDSWRQAGHVDVLVAIDADLQPFSDHRGPQVVERVLLLEKGDGVAPWTTATSVRLEGVGEARLDVSVDGVPIGEVGVGEDLALPGAGWRQLRMTVAEGEVGLQRLVQTYEGAPISGPWPAIETEERACGCGGGAAMLWLLPVLIRRRRR